jgi:hypothetical protein
MKFHKIMFFIHLKPVNESVNYMLFSSCFQHTRTCMLANEGALILRGIIENSFIAHFKILHTWNNKNNMLDTICKYASLLLFPVARIALVLVLLATVVGVVVK